MEKEKTEWVKCPVCGNKTRDKIRKDTVIKNFPLYCPKCKHETLINVRDMTVSAVSYTHLTLPTTERV